LTALFADTWRQSRGPAAGYRYRDLSAEPVPLPGPPYLELGRRMEKVGTVPIERIPAYAENAAERHEWALTLPFVQELRAADTVLIGAPMYNFSVPASLKAWIDRITFPGAYIEPGTGESALRDTTVVVVTARGGAYGPGTPREGFDFQEPYLRAYFVGQLGMNEDNLHFVHAELTLATDLPHLAHFQDMAASSLEAARARVTALGRAGLGSVAVR
jgi:FMN-dependent NADH-azoreductase